MSVLRINPLVGRHLWCRDRKRPEWTVWQYVMNLGWRRAPEVPGSVVVLDSENTFTSDTRRAELILLDNFALMECAEAAQRCRGIDIVAAQGMPS